MKKYIKITKTQANFLLQNDLLRCSVAMIVCKDFANDNGDYVEISAKEIKGIINDEEYFDFEIWVK